jgi:Spy/CpxP family protein refolding chaperone
MLAVLVLGASFGYADDGVKPGGRGRGSHAWDALKLSDDQKTAIHSMMKEQHASMRETYQELRQVHRDLRSETFADKPDEAKIESLKQRAADLETQISAARIDSDRKMAALLTPQQRATMRSMPEPRGRHGWHGGDQAHRGGGDGTEQ